MALSAKEEYIAQCMAQNKTREECERLWNESNSSANTDQQTKEEYINECMAGGKTRQECEDAWAEAHPASTDYATLLKQHEILKAKYDENIEYLKQATRIIKHFQAEKDARDLAEKHKVAVEIEAKTGGRMKYKDLMAESPTDLMTMRRAIDSATPKSFTSVSAIIADSARKKEPMLTVGVWDPEKRKWVGGS